MLEIICKENRTIGIFFDLTNTSWDTCEYQPSTMILVQVISLEK